MADTEMPGTAQAAFDGAVDEVLRRQAAVREHQIQQFLGAWLERQTGVVAAALAALADLPGRLSAETQASNVVAALLAAADVRPPAEESDRPRDELVQEANVDARSPIQYLVLDVLAARHRLGEQVWTFPLRLKTALKVLAAEGLIGWKPGVNQGTALVWLTDAGRAAVLSETYEPPAAPLATHYPGDGHPGCEGATGATAPDAPLDERLAVVLYHTDEPECQPYVEALRNVLILHAENAGTCVECTPGGWCPTDGDVAAWPCPTVRALAEPLVGRFDGVDLAPVPEPARELTEDKQLDDDDVRSLGAGVEPGEHDWRYDRG
jgi:hypothetical protein